MKIPNIFEDQTPLKEFTAGSTIFSAGDTGDEMYVIKEGEVELIANCKVVEVVTADSFFGEMALIEDGPRSASAIAKTDCKLIPINQQRFEFMVHEVPLFAIEVMKVLSKRLRRAAENTAAGL